MLAFALETSSMPIKIVWGTNPNLLGFIDQNDWLAPGCHHDDFRDWFRAFPLADCVMPRQLQHRLRVGRREAAIGRLKVRQPGVL